jgi:surface antigen
VLVPRPPVYYGPPPVAYAPYSGPVQIVPSSRPAYRAADGRYCREYQATITVDGKYQPAYGTACLGPDGAWRIVD